MSFSDYLSVDRIAARFAAVGEREERGGVVEQRQAPKPSDSTAELIVAIHTTLDKSVY